MEAKKASDSQSTMIEFALPNDAKVFGSVLGGKGMHLIDIASALAALRHCRKPVVMASVGSLSFLHPIKVGEMIVLQSQVTRAFTTSLEVEVQVYAEDGLSGERTKTSNAFLTFVAIGSDGKPSPVPPVLAGTAREKQQYREALQRRPWRLQQLTGKRGDRRRPASG